MFYLECDDHVNRILTFIFVTMFVLLSACGSDSGSKGANSKKIDVNEEVAFLDFKATIEKVNIYEEDGTYYIDLPVKWLNLTEEKKMLMQVTSMDVKQSDEILDEVNNAWLNNEGEVRNENASRGEWTADLTYELQNNKDPVQVTFVPLTGEDSESITINIE